MTAAAALGATVLLFTVLVLTAVRTTLFERTPALLRVRPPSGSRQTGR